ncbi:hypothetical protein ACFVVA_37010 [Kitasatospora sp. NPDC058048]|uniref:hypothetical protein n=1 Tax=Kitasatospora sp. NPDC058048 TaxID=3346313 RepID=UPI0036DC6FC9
MVALRHTRGDLPERLFRFCEFMSQQEIDRRNGRILGRYGYDHRDGGVELSERYAEVTGLGKAQFWADLHDVVRFGLAERVVAPAPGRKAVYALCLTPAAIPQQLPEDLTQQLRVWQLPDVESNGHEDTTVGHLTAGEAPAWTAPAAEPVVVELTRHQAADLEAAPRWEHPTGTPAAEAAVRLAEAMRRAAEEDRPRDLRCIATRAPQSTADRITSRLHELAAVEPETSPLYARGVFPHVGFLSDGSRGLMSRNGMGQAQRTRQRGAGAPWGRGDDYQVVAQRVLQACWRSWRIQLGRGRKILPSGTWGADGEWLQGPGSQWDDLRRVIVMALHRSTEQELVHLLTGGIRSADNLGRLAAWRLWRLINTRRNAHGHGPRPKEHIRAERDDLSPAEISRAGDLYLQAMAEPIPRDDRATAAHAAHAAAKARAERQAAEDEAVRREQYERWGIKRAEVAAELAAKRAELAASQAETAAEPRRSIAETQAAAVERARMERATRPLNPPSPSPRAQADRQAETERARAGWNVRLTRWLAEQETAE